MRSVERFVSTYAPGSNEGSADELSVLPILFNLNSEADYAQFLSEMANFLTEERDAQYALDFEKGLSIEENGYTFDFLGSTVIGAKLNGDLITNPDSVAKSRAWCATYFIPSI